WAAAATFTAGGVLALSLPRPLGSPRPGPREPAAERDPMGRRMARLARPPGRVRLARTANTCVRAVGGFCLFLLAFELRRQGVGTAGLGLLLGGGGGGGGGGGRSCCRGRRGWCGRTGCWPGGCCYAG